MSRDSLEFNSYCVRPRAKLFNGSYLTLLAKLFNASSLAQDIVRH